MTDDFPRRLTLEELARPSRTRLNASLVSPICASAQAEEATAQGMSTATSKIGAFV